MNASLRALIVDDGAATRGVLMKLLEEISGNRSDRHGSERNRSTRCVGSRECRRTVPRHRDAGSGRHGIGHATASHADAGSHFRNRMAAVCRCRLRRGCRRLLVEAGRSRAFGDRRRARARTVGEAGAGRLLRVLRSRQPAENLLDHVWVSLAARACVYRSPTLNGLLPMATMCAHSRAWLFDARLLNTLESTLQQTVSYVSTARPSSKSMRCRVSSRTMVSCRLSLVLA